MKLRFYARGTALVREPGPTSDGSAVYYVGRSPMAGFAPLAQAYEVDSNTEMGRRIQSMVRRDKDLWPADIETAAACDVSFTPVQFIDGAWQETASDPEDP